MGAVAGAETTSRLFVLCGIDGAGKTTMLRQAAARRPDWEVGSYEPKSWLPHPDLPHFAWCLEHDPRLVTAALTASTRAAFLASMVVTHFDYWVRPRLTAGSVVLMDSLHYRFLARAQVRGETTALLEAAAADLPWPDMLVLAELDPEVAARRKDGFDPHECSRDPTVGDFVAFQAEVQDALRRMGRTRVRSFSTLDASGPPDAAADQLIALLDPQLTRRAGN